MLATVGRLRVDREIHRSSSIERTLSVDGVDSSPSPSPCVGSLTVSPSALGGIAVLFPNSGIRECRTDLSHGTVYTSASVQHCMRCNLFCRERCGRQRFLQEWGTRKLRLIAGVRPFQILEQVVTERIDPRSNVPIAAWQRLRRFFHLEGSLGSLRYEARLSIIELQDPTTMRVENDPTAAPASRVLSESAGDTPSPAAELQTWESEGGAPIPPR